MKQEKEQIFFRTYDEFWDWLSLNGTTYDALWILFAKKSSKIQSLNYQQALEVSLCYGWIDGIVKSYDSQFYKQRFTPRRKKSMWSSINRDKAERLIKEGKMREKGLEAIEAAKKDGRWENAYSSVKAIQLPEDFALLLKQNPDALVFYESLNTINRYATLHRLETTKNPETRIKKMNTFIEKFLRKEVFYK